ncbi:MAG: NADH-quinone oxidoreductase subunit N [Planctomycetes bacterium]|nr:NADH-quinone oxidoreductase subunit N [Planctomycetota bacterium]
MTGLDGMTHALPILVVALTGTILLLVDSFSKSREAEGPVMLVTGMAGLGVSLFLTLGLWVPASGPASFFAGMGVADHFALFLNVLFIICTALTLLISGDYLKKCGAERGEFYALLFFAATGMMIMVSSTNMVVIFLGLEVMSLCFYILSGYLRTRPQSVEAGMKYFLMGALATGIVFYGIVLVYGVSGQTDLRKLGEWASASLQSHGGEIRSVPNHSVLLLGAALILVGFAFKVASVPFHMWAPDVYEGAPTTVTAFMATGVKAAAFGAFLRVFTTALAPLRPEWGPAVWWLAVLTMSVGNLVALTQANVKRMMAYSSIAHAGYMLIGVYVLDASSVAAVLYYLIAYAFMNIGVFSVISFLETREGRGLSLDEYSGLYARYPGLCVAMAIFMFSLGGIPPTAGFMGKFYVFRSAIEAHEYPLAILGILNSLISLYYYLRVLVRMYMDPGLSAGEAETLPRPSGAVAAATAIAVLATLWLGLGPAVGFGVDDVWTWAMMSQRSIAP